MPWNARDAQPGGSKSVSNWFEGSQLGFAMGIRQAGLPLGGAMAILLLPFIAVEYSVQAAFLAGGLVALVGALLFMLMYRSPAPSPCSPKEQIDLRGIIQSRLSMITEPSMRNIMVSGACLTAAQYAISVFLVLYLHTALGLDSFMATMMFFLVLGSGIVGRICLAAWSDRCKAGRYYPEMACLGAVTALLILLPFVKGADLVILSIFMAVTGFFVYGWYGPWVAYVAESAPADRKGFALGMAMTANQVSVILPPRLLAYCEMSSAPILTAGAYWRSLLQLCCLLQAGVTKR